MLTAAVPGAEAEPCSHKTRLAGGFLAPLEQGVSEVGFLTVLLSLDSRHAALVHRQCPAEAGSPGTQPAGSLSPAMPALPAARSCTGMGRGTSSAAATEIYLTFKTTSGVH